jgi:membrane fusion protein (multidrug efflux system)
MKETAAPEESSVVKDVAGDASHSQRRPAHAKQHRALPADPIKGLVTPLLAVAAALMLVAYSTASWSRWTGSVATQTTDDAQIRSETSRIASRISGTILSMRVEDFQKVHAGDVLAEINPAPYQVEVERAKANVASAEAALANLDNQIALQRATILQAEASLASANAKEIEAKQERLRQESLLPTGAGTKQKAEQAVAAHVTAQANVKAADAALQAQNRQLDVMFGNGRQLTAQLAAAKATLDSAKLQLSYTQIIAPVDGVVGERMVQVGNYVAAGTSLISIVQLPHVYVIADYKETQLTNVTVGQPVNIAVDGLPGISFEGNVEQVSPASGSQFALLPPDNATGNFTKVVQRIPVRITLKPEQPNIGRLRAGMSVITSIRTDVLPLSKTGEGLQ